MIKIRLSSTSGEELLEQSLDTFPAFLGRDSSCNVVLTDAGISGRHVEMGWDGLYLSVRDMGSRNGTFVGKEKINSTKLKLPCALLLGNSVVMEVEATSNAITMRGSVLPKTLKRPAEPVAPFAAALEPVPAKETLDAEVIDGWEIYWHKLKKAPPRPVLLVMILLALAFSLLHYAIFLENFLFSLAQGFGAAIGCALVSAILASLLALPGILFRGAYEFKPLFIIYSVCAMLMTIQIAVLKPAMLMEYFGFIAQLLSIPLIVVSCIPGAYVFLFTTFSHKHAKKLAFASFVFAAVGVFTEGRKVFTVDRQALMRDALMGEFRSARGLAESSSGVKSVTDDIRSFGHRFPSKRD